MAALTGDQLELLRRARDGAPMWGGSRALPRLAADVELLFALGLVETCPEHTYRITSLGKRLLATDTDERLAG